MVFNDWGVNLVCEKGEKAVAVVKLMPSRPESVNTFCEHDKQRLVHVPLRLLRVHDLISSGRMVRREKKVKASTNSRATTRRSSGRGSEQHAVYDLKSEARQHVVLKCRALDNIVD